MNEYTIEISEVLSKRIKVCAENEEEAVRLAEEKYDNEEIILDYKNFAGKNIQVVTE